MLAKVTVYKNQPKTEFKLYHKQKKQLLRISSKNSKKCLTKNQYHKRSYKNKRLNKMIKHQCVREEKIRREQYQKQSPTKNHAHTRTTKIAPFRGYPLFTYNFIKISKIRKRILHRNSKQISCFVLHSVLKKKTLLCINIFDI